MGARSSKVIAQPGLGFARLLTLVFLGTGGQLTHFKQVLSRKLEFGARQWGARIL